MNTHSWLRWIETESGEEEDSYIDDDSGHRKAKSVILYYTRFIQEQSKGSCAITSIAALSTLDSAKYIN